MATKKEVRKFALKNIVSKAAKKEAKDNKKEEAAESPAFEAKEKE